MRHSIGDTMNQKNFRYALYHDEDESVSDILDKIEAVEDFEVVVSIKETPCRDKKPISDRRTTMNIKINSSYDFEQLDRQIERNFVEIWFEH